MPIRIVVKGASGAGKTTLAQALARRFAVPHIELDGLYHGPNWQGTPAHELKKRVLAALDDQRGWVVDGNYESMIGNFVMDRAELVVWLDLPLATTLARLVRRTARRVARREVLWNGNRERIRDVFFSSESLVVWAVRSHFRHRREWPKRLAGVNVVRLRTSAEADAWLANFSAAIRS